MKKALILVAGAWSTEAPSALRTQICPFVGNSEQEDVTGLAALANAELFEDAF